MVTQEIEEFCGAYIDDENGRLVVTDIADADNYYNAQSVFPQGDYHLYDLTFFYSNLKDNVADRVEAFTKNNDDWRAILYGIACFDKLVNWKTKSALAGATLGVAFFIAHSI